MEIKGIISIPERFYDNSKEYIFLTCCNSLPKITIGEVDLHDTLISIFNPDEEDKFEHSWDDKGKPLAKFEVKYVVLPEAPKEAISFNDLALSVIDGWMEPKYVSGCYSEYTCGYGGFDFFVNKHSLFTELEQHVGKFLYLVL